MISETQTLKSRLQEELFSILNYWSKETIDKKNGGFIGQVDYNNIKNHQAEKGSVLHTRILWAFSAAFQYTKEEKHKVLAKYTFDYILSHFYDNVHGGIFWSIYPDGIPKDTKNQIYGLAFTIYGLSEYYKISEDKKALEVAISLYEKIEKHSCDKEKEGYFEAFTRDWKPIDDLRLSEKDANEKKTMNTHLHIVEAYANLYLVWKNNNLKQQIKDLLYVIDMYFIDKNSWHLKLFFDENWNEKPDVVSYGHDIEAAWLLQWCAEVIEDKDLIKKYKINAIKMAEVTKEGIDVDGGLWYEFNPKKKELILEKHSWPQAELWIGMINAYQLTYDETFLNCVAKNFEFVENHIVDRQNGEWFWGINKDYSKMEKDKAGFWKCPYHNTRACLELLKRIS
jgi:cellobiose epimerase